MQLRQHTFTDREREKKVQDKQNRCGAGTFPKDSHHNQIQKNMHNNFNVGKTTSHTRQE